MSSKLARFAAVLAVSAALGGSAAKARNQLASGPRPVECRFHYTSRYTGLQYSYDTRTGAPDGEVTAFRLQTSNGELTGRIFAGEMLSRIVLTHEDSGQSSVVDYVIANGPGFQDVHLAFPERNEDVYYRTDDRAADNISVVSRTGPDCTTLESTGLYLSQKQAIRLLVTDRDLSSRPPDHLEQIAAAVLFSWSLVGLVDGCQGAHDPSAGKCYFDHETYDPCRQCCEDEGGLFAFVCNLGKGMGCKDPWCKKLGSILCGGLRDAYAHTCANIMCNGKPGDPKCPPGQECGLVQGSSCWEFCGITQKSVCGKCPRNQSCCAPI
jgi:hypothetical protein